MNGWFALAGALMGFGLAVLVVLKEGDYNGWFAQWWRWHRTRPHPSQFWCDGCEDKGKGHSGTLYHRQQFQAALWQWRRRRPRARRWG